MSTPPAKARILVVDDAPEYLDLVAGLLRRDGYEVFEAADGGTGVELATTVAPDLVVLDLTLPDLDGMEVCRQIRAVSDSLVLMLTSRDDEIDRVMGLKTGADDYVTKPFSTRELAARIEALLRRSRRLFAAAAVGGNGADDDRAHGGVVVRPSARQVEVDGVAVDLTKIEFDILAALVERPAMVHTRELLRERVWGLDWYGDDHVVDVHIANLRKKIDRPGTPSRIRTIRGVGYGMEV